MDEVTADFVIRLADVAASKDVLERTLGVTLDRYELNRRNTSRYVQISLAMEPRPWSEIAQFLGAVGPKLRGLLEDKAIGSASVDFAVYGEATALTRSIVVPAEVAALAGAHGIDVEVTFYPSAPGISFGV